MAELSWQNNIFFFATLQFFLTFENFQHFSEFSLTFLHINYFFLFPRFCGDYAFRISNAVHIPA